MTFTYQISRLASRGSLKIGATKVVVELAWKAFGEGKYYTLVTLDFKKAFYPARRNRIIEALIVAQMPKYILSRVTVISRMCVSKIETTHVR